MRDYLQLSNVRRAMLLGGIVTVAAVPRITGADGDLWVLVPSAFLSMTLVAGAVTAWGDKGGMVGAFPQGKRLTQGLWVALALGVFFGVVRWLWDDDVFRDALAASGDVAEIEMRFPSTLRGKLSLVLWVAGFQVLFLQAGAMSFLSRLLGRWEYALLLLGILRVLVIQIQMNRLGIPLIASVCLVTTFTTLVGATLFARCGLLAACLFAACMELKTLLL